MSIARTPEQKAKKRLRDARYRERNRLSIKVRQELRGLKMMRERA